MRNTGVSKKLVALGMAGMLVLTAFLVPLAEARADGPARSASVEVRVWQHVGKPADHLCERSSRRWLVGHPGDDTAPAG